MAEVLRILLVDDEEIVRQTIGEYLRECGRLVDEAEDGTAALRVEAVTAFDVALLDIRMPGMDGLSLLGRLREQRPRLPVLLITGHGDVQLAEEALARGATGLLTKPVRLLELDEVLARTIGGD